MKHLLAAVALATALGVCQANPVPQDRDNVSGTYGVWQEHNQDDTCPQWMVVIGPMKRGWTTAWADPCGLVLWRGTLQRTDRGLAEFGETGWRMVYERQPDGCLVDFETRYVLRPVR